MLSIISPIFFSLFREGTMLIDHESELEELDLLLLCFLCPLRLHRASTGRGQAAWGAVLVGLARLDSDLGKSRRRV